MAVLRGQDARLPGTRRIAGALALLATLPIGVQAQMNKAVELTELPLESLMAMEVYSASKFAQHVSDAPSAVSVVTAADIKAFGWRTLADILASMPGLYVRNDRNYSYLGARGFQRLGDYSSRFLLLLDGNRTSDVIYDQAKIGTEFVLDVDLIERVEYVPGPGSSIYGANAFFGVINVVTKRGRDMKGGQASFEAGSYQMRKGRVSAGWQGQNGGEFLLSATGFDTHGQDLYFPEFRDTSGGIARGLDYDRGQQLFMKAVAGPLRLSIAHSDRTKGIPTASFWQAFNDRRSYSVDRQTFVDAVYEQAISPQTEFSARLFSNNYDYLGNLVYGPQRTVNKDIGRAYWWGGEFKVVDSSVRNHKLVAGIEFQRNDKVDQVNYDQDSGLSRLDSRLSGNQAGLFVQDEIYLDKSWLLSMGLRFDRNPDLHDTFSPRLGVIYKASPTTTVKALYGKAYRTPNAYEKYHQIPGNDGQKANPFLQAEHIQTVELVLEQQLQPDANLRLALYRNSVTDLITQTLDPVDGLLSYRNTGKARAIGIDTSLEKVWSGGTKLSGSYSWQQVKDELTGAILNNSPRQLLKANLSAPLFSSRWRAGLESRYVSRRSTLHGEVAGYWLNNLTLFSDRLYRNVEVSASIYNLFDRRYGDPAGPEHLPDLLIQDGRSLRVKLVVAF